MQRTILTLAERQYARPRVKYWPGGLTLAQLDGRARRPRPRLGPPRLYAAEILAAHYGWKLRTHRGAPPTVDTRDVPAPKYGAAHAAVSRALRRLQARGLLRIHRYVEGHRLLLTRAGHAAARQTQGRTKA